MRWFHKRVTEQEVVFVVFTEPETHQRLMKSLDVSAREVSHGHIFCQELRS